MTLTLDGFNAAYDRGISSSGLGIGGLGRIAQKNEFNFCTAEISLLASADGPKQNLRGSYFFMKKTKKKKNFFFEIDFFVFSAVQFHPISPNFCCLKPPIWGLGQIFDFLFFHHRKWALSLRDIILKIFTGPPTFI